METGVFVNCGSYRPRWYRSKRDRVRVHFGFSLEMPESEQSEAITELRESIHELVSTWSQSCYRKVKKKVKGSKVK